MARILMVTVEVDENTQATSTGFIRRVIDGLLNQHSWRERNNSFRELPDLVDQDRARIIDVVDVTGRN